MYGRRTAVLGKGHEVIEGRQPGRGQAVVAPGLADGVQEPRIGDGTVDHLRQGLVADVPKGGVEGREEPLVGGHPFPFEATHFLQEALPVGEKVVRPWPGPESAVAGVLETVGPVGRCRKRRRVSAAPDLFVGDKGERVGHAQLLIGLAREGCCRRGVEGDLELKGGAGRALRVKAEDSLPGS
jgi:hypothetical protein